MDFIAPAIVMITFIVTAGSVLTSLIRSRRDRHLANTQTQLQGRLLERLQGSSEILEYLGSGAGGRFLEGLSSGRASAKLRLLGSIQIGIVAMVLGIGILFMRGEYRDHADTYEALLFFGGFALALGLGMVLSGGVGFWLTQRWRLDELDESNESDELHKTRTGTAPGGG